LRRRSRGADSSLVDQLNAHYLRDVTPPAGSWFVRIPPGLRQAFVINFPRQYLLQRQADVHGDAVARARAAYARRAEPARRRAAAHRHVTHHRTTTRHGTHHRH
jgi:hypothetical protein